MGTFGYFLCLLNILQLVLGKNGYNNMLSYRPLEVDDLLTPSDFLIIAKKLMERVEFPGEGKGIVSSATNLQQLADKLFQRFFFTNARFSPVRVLDISALDSLQALALSGDDFKPSRHYAPLQLEDFAMGLPQRCRYNLITRKPEKIKKVKRILKKAQNEKKKTLKTIVNRQTGSKETNIDRSNGKVARFHRHSKREAVTGPRVTRTHTQPDGRRKNNHVDVTLKPYTIPQAKRLLKNRVMIVQTERKKRGAPREDVKIPNSKIERISPVMSTPMKAVKEDLPTELPKPIEMYDVYYMDQHLNARKSMLHLQLFMEDPPLEIDKEKCYWQYKCKTVGERSFTLCNLRPECEGSGSDHFIRDDIPTSHNVDEHDKALIHFRREVGVCLIDEEVERIIERRYTTLILSAKKDDDSKGNVEKKHRENLKAYFQNIIFAQNQQTTTMSPHERKRQNAYKYKYLRKSNPYGNPEVQHKIKEMQARKALENRIKAEKKKVSHSESAVMSVTRRITTAMPNFMQK